MRESFAAFWAFLKHPVVAKQSTNQVKLRIDFLWLLLLGFLVDALVGMLIYTLEELKLIKHYDDFDYFKEFGKVGAILLVCIVAPILEEYIFRWHLRKKYASIYLVAVGLIIIIGKFFNNTIVICFAFAICFLAATVVVNKTKAKSQTERFMLWNKLFPLNFYLSALFFATAHFNNYEGLTVRDLAFVLYITPPFFAGLIFGYIRVNYGLKYSVLLHAINNLIAIIILLTFA